MKQLTLRQIPDSVGEKLRKKAAQDHQSLNKTAVSALAKGLGVSNAKTSKRDLTKFAGRWSKEDLAEFERNTAIFETIDNDIWAK